uniref:Uncharacterized protein n=1 Tax=Fusarium oxysporum (strain Fo5176) TaxID=660025 RepID=A0A0D2Y0Z2_FUSOF
MFPGWIRQSSSKVSLPRAAPIQSFLDVYDRIQRSSEHDGSDCREHRKRRPRPLSEIRCHYDAKLSVMSMVSILGRAESRKFAQMLVQFIGIRIIGVLDTRDFAVTKSP